MDVVRAGSESGDVPLEQPPFRWNGAERTAFAARLLWVETTSESSLEALGASDQKVKPARLPSTGFVTSETG
jgi:hypothetical protein